jgi:hypothetical protein
MNFSQAKTLHGTWVSQLTGANMTLQMAQVIHHQLKKTKTDLDNFVVNVTYEERMEDVS